MKLVLTSQNRTGRIIIMKKMVQVKDCQSFQTRVMNFSEDKVNMNDLQLRTLSLCICNYKKVVQKIIGIKLKSWLTRSVLHQRSRRMALFKLAAIHIWSQFNNKWIITSSNDIPTNLHPTSQCEVLPQYRLFLQSPAELIYTGN